MCQNKSKDNKSFKVRPTVTEIVHVEKNPIIIFSKFFQTEQINGALQCYRFTPHIKTTTYDEGWREYIY